MVYTTNLTIEMVIFKIADGIGFTVYHITVEIWGILSAIMGIFAIMIPLL